MTTLQVLARTRSIALVLLGGASIAGARSGVSVNPQTLSFVYQIGGPIPPAQNIFLSGDIPTQLSVTISGAPWLTITPLSANTPDTLVATVTPPVGAASGTLSGTIVIGSTASVDAIGVAVPVSLEVLGQAPGSLVISPTSIVLDYQTGSPALPRAVITIHSSGGLTTFALNVSTATGGRWLSVSTNSDVTPALAYVDATPLASMPPGTYTGTISVIPAHAGGVLEKVDVTLRVSATGTLTAVPNHLSFNYQTGTPFPMPQVVNIVNSSAGGVTFSVAASASGGGSWLASSAAGGIVPSSILVSTNPGGLKPGTYFGTLVITTTSGALEVTQVSVTLTVVSVSELLANPSSLTTDYRSGGPAPEPQYISAMSTGTPLDFAASIAGPSWISLSTAQGVTPASIAVLVNPPAGTGPGTYNATITLAPASNGGSTASVSVSVRVRAPNYISVGRSNLSFASSVGSSNLEAAVIPVTSFGGSFRFDTIASSSAPGSWLHASQSSPSTPASIFVNASPQGLAPGTYTGTVSVVSEDLSNRPQLINVTLTVAAGPFLRASPSGLIFSYQIGGANPPLQALAVSNQGTPLPFSIGAETTSGGEWLLAVGGGTTPAAVAAAVDPGSLSEGTYAGNLIIKLNDSSGLVLRVPVILNVSADPVFVPSVNQISFRYQRGGSVPGSQRVTINTSSAGPTVFYSTIQISNNGQWLKLTPDFAVSPGDLEVSVNPQGLTPGLYSAVIVLNAEAADTPMSYVPVSLQVSDDPAAAFRGSGSTSLFQPASSGGSWPEASPAGGSTDVILNRDGVNSNGVVAPDGLAPSYYMGLIPLEIL